MNHSLRQVLFAGVTVAVCTLLGACERKPQSPVIARVGDAVLTLEDLQSSIPAEYSDSITREQNINYVKQWFDTELLHQEALRRDLQREPAIRMRLEKMKRDLLSAELISRISVQPETVNLSEDAIRQYWEHNSQAFLRERNVVRFEQIVFSDCALAERIRPLVNQQNFSALASKYSTAPTTATAAQAPYVPVDQLPADIGQTLWGLRIDGITAPVRTGQGCVVFHLLDKQAKGSASTLDEVRNDIIDRISMQAQRQEIERLLNDLRMRMNCSLHPDRIPAGARPAAADSIRKP